MEWCAPLRWSTNECLRAIRGLKRPTHDLGPLTLLPCQLSFLFREFVLRVAILTSLEYEFYYLSLLLQAAEE